MRTTARLGLFGVGLAAVFGVAAMAANAFVPSDIVENWTAVAAADSTAGDHTQMTAPGVRGLSIEQSGFRLDDMSAPTATGEPGILRFEIVDPSGAPLTAYEVDNDKELHLIVVRTDGSGFRHEHPARAEDGTWSMPWTWNAAGSYRVYVDFRTDGAAGPVDVTLSQMVDVAGDYEPTPLVATSTDSVDGFEVSIAGELDVGESSELTLSIDEDGKPVTELQPYLGAFGHLVALRSGDLAYLHVHPEGDQPSSGDVSGPEVAFAIEAPSAGIYLLFFNFQVDGRVHTASFALDSGASGSVNAGHTSDH